MEPTEFVLSEARLVLPDRVVEHGWIAVSHGRIAEFGEGRPPERGLSVAGDTLIPGLVELHTDHLEAHVSPRPGVRWNARAAVQAYDAQIAASGITTVFDSLRVGSDADYGSLGEELFALAEAIAEAQAERLLRADHHTHLRCEVCSEDVIDEARQMTERFTVGMMSLMDHTPGARQFRDVRQWKKYYGGKSTMSEADLDRMIEARKRKFAERHDSQRATLVAIARAKRITLASHDDTTLDHVAQSIADGARLAEFPTTVEAAAASHGAGIAVMMGAPNVVRGGSHSGNVAAEALAREGTLDILSSDYVPGSLLHAAFDLPRRVPTISLPQSIALVAANPARAVGFADRGAIAAGLRADLVRVRLTSVPVVRAVWLEGRRVA